MKFKVYVSICLTLIVLLLATLTGALIFAGLRVNQASKNVTGQVTTFNQNVNNINKNLENINSQLQTATQATHLP